MNTLEWLSQTCEQIFQDNLMCVLLIGSAQRQDTTPFSDIDLVIIVRTMDVSQVYQLRLAIRSSKVLLDCSILCFDELPEDPNDFCLGSHGCYQLELVLKNATCISGKNVLLSLGSPSEQQVRLSLVKKITEYTWWVRRMFIESNRERSLEMNYKLNSRLLKMLRDILYLRGDKGSITSSVAALLDKFTRDLGELFNAAELKAIQEMGDQSRVNENTSDMSDEYLLLRYSIANKIFKYVSQSIE